MRGPMMKRGNPLRGSSERAPDQFTTGSRASLNRKQTQTTMNNLIPIYSRCFALSCTFNRLNAAGDVQEGVFFLATVPEKAAVDQAVNAMVSGNIQALTPDLVKAAMGKTSNRDDWISRRTLNSRPGIARRRRTYFFSAMLTITFDALVILLQGALLLAWLFRMQTGGGAIQNITQHGWRDDHILSTVTIVLFVVCATVLFYITQIRLAEPLLRVICHCSRSGLHCWDGRSYGKGTENDPS